MKKSILVLLLSLVLVLAACGNNSNNDDSGSKSEKSGSKDTLFEKINILFAWWLLYKVTYLATS